jgi:hypothetical protein
MTAKRFEHCVFIAPGVSYNTRCGSICILLQRLVMSAALLHGCNRSTSIVLLHHVRQFVGDDGITDQGARLVLPWPKGNVFTYGERSSVETIRERRRSGVGVYANVRKALAECGLHARSHAAIQGAT